MSRKPIRTDNEIEICLSRNFDYVDCRETINHSVWIGTRIDLALREYRILLKDMGGIK